jgi:hypothetical protein
LPADGSRRWGNDHDLQFGQQFHRIRLG